MKKILSVFLALIIVASITPFNRVAAGEDTNAAIIIVDNESAMPGSTVDVAINIEENPGIASMGLTLSFGSGLKLIKATNGKAFSGLTMTPPNQLNNGGITGSCRFAWLGNDNVTENGTILLLKFEVLDDAILNNKCVISISCAHGDVLDERRNAVGVITTSGSVTVIDYIPGDVDENNIINMLDVLSLCQYYVDGCQYDPDGYAVSIKEEAGDVDGNGRINMLDVLMVCQYYVDGCQYDPDGYAVKLLPGLPKHNHTMEEIPAKAATCTEDGNIACWHCITCGKNFSDANGGNELADITISGGHTVVIDPAVPATETETGLTEGSHCLVCGEILIPQIVTGTLEPNTRSITYHIVDVAKHPYLASQQIDESSLDHSYVPGETKKLKGLDTVLANYGYSFEGWYDGFGDNASQIKEIKASETENVELFAHVKELVYDITYNMYQVPVTSSPTERQLHYTVSQGNSNLYTPDINNYKFLGWYDNNGVEYKTIPIGSTGPITLNAYYTSLRNYAVSIEDNNPIIVEDKNSNVVYFTYEIGEIRHVPLNGEHPFWILQSVAGLTQKKSDTYTTEITSTEADTVSKTIADMATNSSTWTLSESWNNVTTVNESWAQSIEKEAEVCQIEATTASNTLSISNQQGGSSYHKTEDGSTVYDYDSKTVTNDKGHQFDASISGNYTNKAEANLGASTEFGATDSYGYTKKTKKTDTNESSSVSDKDILSAGVKYENGFEVNAGVSYGYHNNTNTVTKTGTDKITTNSNIDENTSSWNSSAMFSATQQHSSSTSVRNLLSDIVTTTKGYGSSYSDGGTDTNTQGFSSTVSNTSGTTSSVTYSKKKGEMTTTEYGTDGKIEGKYRSILVGTAHVFAVVGYDYATKSFFTYTFSVMDDKTEEFLDYTPNSKDFDDCENTCLPFEVPYYVFEYVAEKTAKTTGVEYTTNSRTGTAKITRYTGSDTDVIIPSYVSDGNQAYKVTEIAENVFSGKLVRSVVLGEYIEAIPDRAFKNCSMLEEVIGSFTEIGDEAFAGCTNLTNMNIPSNVVKIGTDAFAGVNSIKVRAINSLSAYAEAIKALPEDADDVLVEAKQREITQKYIKSVLECGAQNIVLDLSYIAADTSLYLEVPAIESIEIDGGSKTYNDIRIDSNASETAINDMTIFDDRGTAIKVDSDKLTLHKVFVTGNTTALILKKDGAILSLDHDSAIESGAAYSIIGKNLIIESQRSNDSAVGYLSVAGNFGYVNTINGEDYVDSVDYVDTVGGQLKRMSQEEFNKYVQGVYTVTFDVNGGKALDETEKTVYLGDTYGLLPPPTRDYYTFEGWFSEVDGGLEIMPTMVYDTAEDITLYAHWEINPLSDWVLVTEVPDDARVDNIKWSYDYSSAVELEENQDYVVVNAWTEWSDYGNWSEWTRTEVIPSDSRAVETQYIDPTYKTQYFYDRYATTDNKWTAWGKGTFSGYYCGTYQSTGWLDTRLTVVGYPDGHAQYGSYGTINANYWYNEQTRRVVVTDGYSQYRYRDRYLIYNYSLESFVDPTGQADVSNVQELVRYRMK